MGGYGSGRWKRKVKKETVESYRSIDVLHWYRTGMLAPGSFSMLDWVDDGGQERYIGIAVFDQDSVTIVNPRSHEPEARRYTMGLSWSPCTYGGVRPWFVCGQCERRSRKLYLKSERFACRNCLGLVYESQREPDDLRLIHLAQAARKRLGGSPNLFGPFPVRPKRQHNETYHRLKDKALCVESLAFQVFMARTARLSRFLRDVRDLSIYPK